MESNARCLGNHYFQKTQMLIMFGSHLPPFAQGKQQKIKNVTRVIFTNFGHIILVIFSIWSSYIDKPSDLVVSK